MGSDAEAARVVGAAAAIFFVAFEIGRRSISASRGVRMLSADKPLDRESGAGNLATRTRNGASRILRNVTVCRAGGSGSSAAVMPKADCR